MRVTVDTDYLLDRLQLDKYGFGIPFAFFVVGIVLLYWSLAGIAMLRTGGLTGYGKLGLFIVVALAVLSIASAGYTYRAVDKTWWLLDKFRDGPPAIREKGADSDEA